MVSQDTLQKLCQKDSPGYKSLYGFSEQDAQIIIQNGSSKGFKYFTPFSSELVIDIDTGTVDLIACEAALKDRGLGYVVEESGSKGYHVTIKHQPVYDSDLPYSQRSFVSELGFTYDEGLYRPDRLIRLRRTIHEKTGRRKKIIKIIKGSILELPIIPQPEIDWSLTGSGEGSDIQTVLMRCLDATLNDVSPGSRYNTLFTLARDFNNCGLSGECALEVLTQINDTWSESKESSEVKVAVEHGFK